MGFPYHFVDLDEKQQLQRRHLLDSYGQFAQLSLLIAFLVYQIVYGLRLLAGRWRSQHRYRPVKEHQSPIVSTYVASANIPSIHIRSRVHWALNDELIEGWGTKKVWLVALIWSVWLLVMAVRDTGDGTWYGMISFEPADHYKCLRLETKHSGHECVNLLFSIYGEKSSRSKPFGDPR